MILSVYLKSYFSDCYVHLTLVLIHFVKRRLLMEWQSPCSLMKFSPRAVESSHPISSQLVVVLLFLRLRLFLKNAYTQRILQNTNSKNHRSKSKSKQIEEFHEYKKSTPLTDIGEGWADVNTWCLSLRETNTNIMITFQWKRGREFQYKTSLSREWSWNGLTSWYIVVFFEREHPTTKKRFHFVLETIQRERERETLRNETKLL